jgi:WD40 repeat protein
MLGPYGPDVFVSVSFSPDGRYVAAGDSGGILWILDARTGQLVTKRKTGKCSTVDLKVLFTPDGKGFATGGDTLQCWDFSSSKDILSGRHTTMDEKDIPSRLNQIFVDSMLKFVPLVPFFSIQILKQLCFQGPITAISISSDNQWAVSSSRSVHNRLPNLDNSLLILDARNGGWVCTLKGHVRHV